MVLSLNMLLVKYDRRTSKRDVLGIVGDFKSLKGLLKLSHSLQPLTW